MARNGQLSVPPGFRFHPTEEELLYYYLRKKVSFEAIHLDIIKEIDLNKLEPWDLEDKCRIGSSCQNEWYFFSHKDKKYPIGTRINRATTAGFWKATGRDTTIYMSNSKRIGMRKTLVFYIGRAPHGKRTDWIMHEYRLDDANVEVQDDGWVVCRVFKKKIYYKTTIQNEISNEKDQQFNIKPSESPLMPHLQEPKLQNLKGPSCDFTFDGSMHLRQLMSPEFIYAPTFYAPPPQSSATLNSMDIECSQSLLRRATSETNYGLKHSLERFDGITFGKWSFLDELLASHQGQHHHFGSENGASASSRVDIDHVGTSTQKCPFPLVGYDQPDIIYEIPPLD